MTSSPGREAVVDRLRGFALLGIVIVNAPFLLTSLNGITERSMPTTLDRVAGFITWAVFQGKSYVIFAFLFGYSFAILRESATRRGLDSLRILRRRMAALVAFGAVHAVLLFSGDILVLYGLGGVALIALRDARDRTLLRIAGAMLVVQTAVLGILVAFPGSPDDLGALDVIDRSLATDGLVDATATRLAVWPIAFLLVLALQGFLVIGLFCVGLVCGRRRLLAEPAAITLVLRRIRLFGLALGLPPQVLAGLLAVWPGADADPRRTALALLIMYPTAPVLAAGYIATIALLPRRGLARIVEHDGQMSLTVYLGESLLLTTLAAGWGFGLFGMDTAAAFAVAVAAWAVMLAASVVWSRRYGVGPLERILRRLTYGRAGAG